MGVRLLIASQVRVYREGLVRVLQEMPEITVVGSAATASETLAQALTLKPDVSLIDMALPAALSAVKQIAGSLQATRIVVLGLTEDEEEVLSCAQIGVTGYVTRDASLPDLVAAIQAAARGEAQLSPRIAGSLLRRLAALAASQQPQRCTLLTARESQILTLVQQCMSNKMISQRLGIELATVKNHVHSILSKLGLHRRAELIALLNPAGPVHPGGADR